MILKIELNTKMMILNEILVAAWHCIISVAAPNNHNYCFTQDEIFFLIISEF